MRDSLAGGPPARWFVILYAYFSFHALPGLGPRPTVLRSASGGVLGAMARPASANPLNNLIRANLYITEVGATARDYNTPGRMAGPGPDGKAALLGARVLASLGNRWVQRLRGVRAVSSCRAGRGTGRAHALFICRGHKHILHARGAWGVRQVGACAPPREGRTSFRLGAGDLRPSASAAGPSFGRWPRERGKQAIGRPIRPCNRHT